jgi:hypothetical protein
MPSPENAEVCAPTACRPHVTRDSSTAGAAALGATAPPASIGSVGDAYDNAMAESFVDTFKTELIADRVWRTRSQLELATVQWVAWFNNDRLHESLSDARRFEQQRKLPALVGRARWNLPRVLLVLRTHSRWSQDARSKRSTPPCTTRAPSGTRPVPTTGSLRVSLLPRAGSLRG